MTVFETKTDPRGSIRKCSLGVDRVGYGHVCEIVGAPKSGIFFGHTVSLIVFGVATEFVWGDVGKRGLGDERAMIESVAVNVWRMDIFCELIKQKVQRYLMRRTTAL